MRKASTRMLIKKEKKKVLESFLPKKLRDKIVTSIVIVKNDI